MTAAPSLTTTLNSSVMCLCLNVCVFLPLLSFHPTCRYIYFHCIHSIALLFQTFTHIVFGNKYTQSRVSTHTHTINIGYPLVYSTVITNINIMSMSKCDFNNSGGLESSKSAHTQMQTMPCQISLACTCRARSWIKLFQ